MASELRHRAGGGATERFKLRLMYPGSDPGVLQCQIEPDQTVKELREHARQEHPLFCHYDTVTLITGGTVLQDDSCLLRDVLDDKSAIMVGPPARAPPRRVFRSADADEIRSMDDVGRDAVDEDLEEPEDMQGPSVSQRQKEIGNWLKTKCHMPSALLAVFYLLSLQTWGAFLVRPHQDAVHKTTSQSTLQHCQYLRKSICVFPPLKRAPSDPAYRMIYRTQQLLLLQMWMIGARWAAKRDFGALYVGGSIIALIFCNLGKRKAGEASGYSIFNAGFRRLPGDFDEQQLDNAFRGRM